MPGTPYATTYYVKTGEQPGPTIFVMGGCHGDEPAGYLAADKIAKWRVTRGTLWVLPRAHKQAIARKMRGYPGNMNNMFPGKADGTDMEKLANGIWRTIVAAKPDVLISLHESRDFHARDSSRYGQTLSFDFPKLVPTMQKALDRTNPDIAPKLHKFLNFVKPFPHCPTYNCWTQLRVPATAIETSKTLPLLLRVRYQLMMSMGFLDEWGLGYEQRDLPRLSTYKKVNSPEEAAIKNKETVAEVTALMRPITAATSSENAERLNPIIEHALAKSAPTKSDFSLVWIGGLSLLGAGLGWIGFQGWSRK